MLEDDVKDPWWTLLVFFNSLRELGTSVSLLQSDIPDYFRVVAKRLGLESADVRRIWRDTELTGRLRNDEVPAAIEDLERELRQLRPLQPHRSRQPADHHRPEQDLRRPGAEDSDRDVSRR